VVSPGYFETLGIPLRRGRPLTASDTRDAPLVAVVDAAMAEAVWADVDPVGRRVRLDPSDRWITVVGVSAEVRGAGLAAGPSAGFYVPFTPRPDNPVEVAVGRDMVFLAWARAGLDPTLAAAVRTAVQEADPGLPVATVEPLKLLLEDTTSPHRFRTLLVGVFACIAVVMAIAGLNGVVSQLLGERRRELTIRSALGATRSDLIREVLGWGLRLAGMGIALGLMGVLLGSHLLTGLVYGVGAADPATVATATVLVLLMSIGACIVPAVRAARGDASLGQ